MNFPFIEKIKKTLMTILLLNKFGSGLEYQRFLRLMEALKHSQLRHKFLHKKTRTQGGLT
jgi:hypothetical protein